MKVCEPTSPKTSLSLAGSSSHRHSAVARIKSGVEGRREESAESSVAWKVSEVTPHQESRWGRNRMEGVTLLSSRMICGGDVMILNNTLQHQQQHLHNSIYNTNNSTYNTNNSI